MATYKELLRQQEELGRQVDAARKREKADAVAKVHALMGEHGLTASDITGRKRGGASARNAKVAPKYRDPATGRTWTGRGKAPKWIEGQNRDKFVIS
jgi:DNA-binding protein H-NS